MTKDELITKVANATESSKASVNRMLGALTDEITKVLRKGDKVALPGLGTFSVAKRARRKGRNPQTGEPITIPASKVPKFKPSPKLRDAVNKRRK